MLIGEAPGFTELIEEKPFVGDAGRVLNGCLKDAGMSREEVYVTNVVKCRPPDNRPPEPAEIAACLPYLVQEIKAVKPKVIVLLGATPLMAILGKKGITTLRGQVFTSEDFNCQIVPTFHPAYVMRRADDSTIRSKFIEDLVLARRFVMTGRLEKTRQPVEYALVDNMPAFDALMERLKHASVIDFDLETTGSHPKSDKVICISFSVREREAFVVPLWVEGKNWWGENHEAVVSKLKVIMESDIPKCCQAGALIDIPFMRGMGIQVAHYEYDTLTMDYLLDENKPENQRSLKDFTWELTDMGGYEMELEGIVKTLGIDKSTEGLSRIPMDILWKYAATDADVLGRCRRVLYERMKKQELTFLFHNITMPVANVLIDIEEAGVKVNKEGLQSTADEYDRMVVELDGKLETHPDVIRATEVLKLKKKFNFNSPDQLRKLLFTFLGLPIISRTKKTKKPSTDADVLEELSTQHEIPKLLLTRKQYSKQVSYLRKTLTSAIAEDGRIHTRYLVHGTETGRLSSRHPNLQNIPRKSDDNPIASRVRDVFVADDGCVLIDADYSQIEFRLLARYSGDARMMDDIRRNVDIHVENAILAYGKPREEITKAERQAAKGLTYLMIYGGSAYRVVNLFNVTIERAQEIIDMMFTKYPGAMTYQQEMVRIARERQYVTDLFGQRRRLLGILSSDKKIREHNERSAINAPIQGLAAKILYIAMIRLNAALKKELPQAKMVLTVHDSLTVECPEHLVEQAVTIMRREMLTPMPGIKVPLDVDVKVGKSLGSMKVLDKNPDTAYNGGSLQSNQVQGG
jgi:DNA polymerase-1